MAARVLAVSLGAFVVVDGYGGPGQAYSTLPAARTRRGTPARGSPRSTSAPGETTGGSPWQAWKEHPLTGTGAGTFQYTWLEDRPGLKGVKQVHNVYLEQGTETGVFAFLALSGFRGGPRRLHG